MSATKNMSELTILANLLLERMEDMYKTLTEEWETPFGMEAIGGAEYKRRWGAMTPEQRVGEINRLGMAKILEVMRA